MVSYLDTVGDHICGREREREREASVSFHEIAKRTRKARKERKARGLPFHGPDPISSRVSELSTN